MTESVIGKRKTMENIEEQKDGNLDDEPPIKKQKMYTTSDASIISTKNENIPEILLLGDLRLRDKCLDVDLNSLNTKLFKHQCKQLKIALQMFRDKHGFGRAISAIQINIKLRMIAMFLGNKYTHLKGVTKNKIFLILNPKIIYKSEDDMFTLWDDCMSFPNLLIKLKRYKYITFKFNDINGNEIIWDYNDIGMDLSELIQHETDHCNNILAIDREIDINSILLRSVFNKNKQKYNNMVDYNIYSYLNQSKI